jgi:GGDEF domain-containing protein
MLIAIDRLGHLRDVHGYEAKERIVAAVVALLMRATRSSDFLGRTADDGLMAIIPHTPPEGVATLAARLVAEAALSPVEAAGKRIPITLSIGFAHNQRGDPERGAAPRADPIYSDALLRGAEAALRAAVERGGGCSLERPPG